MPPVPQNDHEPRATVPLPSGPDGRVVIGWSEYVALPAWGVEAVHAKIDTGARTSALHVENIEEVGEDRVRFDVVLSRRNPARRVTVEADAVKRAAVRSSSGAKRKRWFVRTRMILGGVEKEILLSLVSRDKMVFRMLIGREALNGDFLVDSAHRRLAGGRPPRKPRAPRSRKTASE